MSEKFYYIRTRLVTPYEGCNIDVGEVAETETEVVEIGRNGYERKVVSVDGQSMGLCEPGQFLRNGVTRDRGAVVDRIRKRLKIGIEVNQRVVDALKAELDRLDGSEKEGDHG